MPCYNLYSLVPQSDFRYLNSVNPLLFTFPLRGLFKRFVFTVQIRFLLSPFLKQKKNSHCLVLRPLRDLGGCTVKVCQQHPLVSKVFVSKPSGEIGV